MNHFGAISSIEGRSTSGGRGLTGAFIRRRTVVEGRRAASEGGGIFCGGRERVVVGLAADFLEDLRVVGV